MKPWTWLPAQQAHDWASLGLNLLTPFNQRQSCEWGPFKWKGLEFSNRLGTAGGVDKNAQNLKAWWSLDVGFVEIGTVTPNPQAANPGKVLDRNLSYQSVWNKLGFPSHGADKVVERLQRKFNDRVTPVFVNVGKNRMTELADAHLDYAQCFEKLAHVADAFVVNISSPNTPGLRELLSKERFPEFMEKTLNALRKNPKARMPLILKISPDLDKPTLENVIDKSCKLGVDGWILTNTTLQRSTETQAYPADGGVSGRPLAPLAKQCLLQTQEILGARRAGKLLISTGGIITPEDVQVRLALGADLVQIYSGLILNGPFFFRSVAKFMLENEKWNKTSPEAKQ